MSAEQQMQMQQAQAQEQQQQQQQAGRRQQGSSVLGTSVKQQRGAKNGGWGGNTHTVDRARSIERENANLVKHLTEIATASRSSAQKGGRGAPPPPGAPKPRASASINRQRQNDQIAQENARLAKRLAGAKPAVSNFKDHAAKQDAYKRNASRARVRCPSNLPPHRPPPPRPSPPRLTLRLPRRIHWVGRRGDLSRESEGGG